MNKKWSPNYVSFYNKDISKAYNYICLLILSNYKKNRTWVIEIEKEEKERERERERERESAKVFVHHNW